MDTLTLIYFGLVCGILALAAPMGSTGTMRFGFGLCVGLMATAFLPLVHHAFVM